MKKINCIPPTQSLEENPLWCEGPKVYCFGTNMLMQKVPVDKRITQTWPDSAEGGNVIDFSKGINSPVISREISYGSSGGIKNDPWK